MNEQFKGLSQKIAEMRQNPEEIARRKQIFRDRLAGAGICVEVDSTEFNNFYRLYKRCSVAVDEDEFSGFLDSLHRFLGMMARNTSYDTLNEMLHKWLFRNGLE